jgi:hypothetical protein
LPRRSLVALLPGRHTVIAITALKGVHLTTFKQIEEVL